MTKMNLTKEIIVVLVLLVLWGCECVPCKPCPEIEFVDTAMISHKGCVRPELYNPDSPMPVCVGNYNYTLAGFNLKCEYTNESMVDGVQD